MNEKQEVSKVERPAAELPSMMPRVDVFEDATGITLLADLPGVPKDKLALRVEGNTLQIEGDLAQSLTAPMPSMAGCWSCSRRIRARASRAFRSTTA